MLCASSGSVCLYFNCLRAEISEAFSPALSSDHSAQQACGDSFVRGAAVRAIPLVCGDQAGRLSTSPWSDRSRGQIHRRLSNLCLLRAALRKHQDLGMVVMLSKPWVETLPWGYPIGLG